MAANPKGYIVSGLTDYVEVNKDTLIKSVVLGAEYGDTIPNMRKQLGVKTTEILNFLDVDPVLQNGQGCGFTANGSTVFSEREIETVPIKVNDEWCPDDLLGKYAEFLVRYGANANAEEMPFEREILSEIERKIAQKMETIVWQGDSGLGITGLLELAEDGDSASTIVVTATTADTLYDRVEAVVLAIPEEILDKAVVFLSPANYRDFVMAMVKKNYIHFGPDGTIEDKDITFPGTEIKIHKTYGLKNSNLIYASAYENLVYGADLMNDREEARLWFSDDDDLFKLKIKWNAGVTTLYPDMVVLGTPGR